MVGTPCIEGQSIYAYHFEAPRTLAKDGNERSGGAGLMGFACGTSQAPITAEQLTEASWTWLDNSFSPPHRFTVIFSSRGIPAY